MPTKASRMNLNLKASDRIYGYHVWCYNFFFLDSIIISCHYFIVIHYIGVISRNVKLFSKQTLILATAVYVVNDGYVRLPGYHFVIKEPLIQVFTQGKCQPCAKVYYKCASGNLLLETGSESELCV